jgi:hypothetical protein
MTRFCQARSPGGFREGYGTDRESAGEPSNDVVDCVSNAKPTGVGAMVVLVFDIADRTVGS